MLSVRLIVHSNNCQISSKKICLSQVQVCSTCLQILMIDKFHLIMSSFFSNYQTIIFSMRHTGCRTKHESWWIVLNVFFHIKYFILKTTKRCFLLLSLVLKKNYGRRHLKLFTNCHVSWDTLYVNLHAPNPNTLISNEFRNIALKLCWNLKWCFNTRG